ncbi:MAG: anthrone oxygenase family protein [Pseudomonadota bacterium]
MTTPPALAALLFHGAIFDFFYAWICSTIWGLNTLPAGSAIDTMMAMNASVRNAVFAPIFFATPLVSVAAGLSLWGSQPAWWFCAAAAIYIVGAMVPTMLVNVPMNEALAALTPEQIAADAEGWWSAYADRWQRWNIARCAMSGAALLCVGMGLVGLQR